MAEKYITEEQRAGCRKVADAFAELYELTDVVVADAGRFGFVRLQWFSEGEKALIRQWLFRTAGNCLRNCGGYGMNMKS